ncbi:hypothetical protein CDL60_14015 [Roseateles noduli]|nr:hypothetical protein CDL60_14015 [Roseateles noduli]
MSEVQMLAETLPPIAAADALCADVLILAAPRDASLTRKLLNDAGVCSEYCANEASLMQCLSLETGSVLVAEEMLTPSLRRHLTASIRAQPPWSDLPVIIVASASAEHLPLSAVAELGNVAMLHRPMSPDALRSAVSAALRARRRQWQVRDLLRQQREQAERKDQFLAMLAHELRNPLTPIRYAAHLLQLDELPPERQSTLARLVDRQVGHMGRIIDQLLDVSRLTRGLVQLTRAPVNLCALARDTLAAHAIAAQGSGVLLDCRCDCEAWVEGDGTRLRQVIDNLVDNAIKFSSPGDQVNVSLSWEGDRVQLIVQDEGDGIEPHLQDQLFDAFVQADRSLERSRGGLGLGLALVKGLVSLHGGEVSMYSAGPEQGSTFTVSLPALRGSRAEEIIDVDTSPKTALTSRDVLLAEDNVDAADSLRMILEGHGHRVAVVHNGPAALEALRLKRPQVLICDIGLPGLSGYDVARAAQDAHRPTLMLALTGYGSAEDRKRAADAGFDGHLAKPVAVPALLAWLSAALPGTDST